MKKIILSAFVIVSFMVTSCRKERSCECTVTTTTVHSTGSISTSNTDVYTSHVTKEKETKKYFRITQQCYSTTSTDTRLQGNTTTTTTEDASCTLK